MNIEKRTAIILRGDIIAILKYEEYDVISDYIRENYMDIGLYYEDVSELEFRTIYIEI